MSKIIIQLQGGLVQDVFIKGLGKPTAAIVIDEDTEGTDDYLTYVGEDGEEHQASIHTEKISKLFKGCDMERAMKAYQSTQKRSPMWDISEDA
jgi:hypothetical protein